MNELARVVAIELQPAVPPLAKSENIARRRPPHLKPAPDLVQIVDLSEESSPTTLARILQSYTLIVDPHWEGGLLRRIETDLSDSLCIQVLTGDAGPWYRGVVGRPGRETVGYLVTSNCAGKAHSDAK